MNNIERTDIPASTTVVADGYDTLHKMLKKTGVNASDIFSVAIANWINRNLKLLTAEEKKKYQKKQVIVLYEN